MNRLLLLLLLLTWPCLAQFSNITLSGMVVTGARENVAGLGEPLGGVEIEVLGTGFVTTSDANGYFFFRDLPDGQYTLIGRKDGFPLGRLEGVQVRFGGIPSRCQMLMNEYSGAMIPGMSTVIPGGAIYIAYSKKYDGVLRREGSPYELLAQKILKAGGKLPGLKPEYVGPVSSLNNPICVADNYLMVYPPNNPTRAAFLDLPGEPHWVAFDPKGTFLYVACHEIDMVQIYNAASDHSLVRNLPVSGRITELSVSRDGKYLLACVMGQENGVLVVDTTTNLPLKFLPTPWAPWSALSVGPRVFACWGDARNGEVCAFDRETGTLVGRCKVGHQPTGLASPPDESTLLVCCAGNACVSLVDTVSVAETGRIQVGVNPKKLAVSPDGGTCAVSNWGSNTVTMLDLKTRAVKAQVNVGKQPLGITYDRSGKKIYVTCNEGGSIQILDGRLGTVLHSTVPMPHAVPWGLCIRP